MKLTKYVLTDEEHTDLVHVERAVKGVSITSVPHGGDPASYSDHLHIDYQADTATLIIVGGACVELEMTLGQLYALASLIKIHEAIDGPYSHATLYKEVEDV